MQAHSHCKGFAEAARFEFETLQIIETFVAVPYPSASASRVLPLLWVFSYRFDPDRFLVKYKARICVRRDLQQFGPRENYAAILAAKVFCALMAIIVAFDLEAEHLDVMHAFVKSNINEVVYRRFPYGFEKKGRVCSYVVHFTGYDKRRSSG